MTRRKTAPTPMQIGPLSSRGRGRHFLLPSMNFTPPVTFCAATVDPHKQPYTGERWHLRLGAEDHKKHPSRGF